MKTIEKNFSKKVAPSKAALMVQAVCGCKWSLTIYQLLGYGINRPGEMVRRVDGLTTKVLNQCLRKNIEFGILARTSYNEVPPRVEYEVTEFGSKFMKVLDELEQLQNEIYSNE
ncbi:MULTISPECIES: winged helix-turn-helix transcriptional regulator [Alteromonas]|jgi:DNA-binding HxlR family transcriptional regulator|uniref:HxlR family transcriptional regulator n=1 Tax=Alteromonas stellipolaris TaxID=233316 RepID=A0AAW7Z450_9ALTE|nr:MULTISPECIES: winged helix-turn-helix transcriptional regulator [Alteromonas]AMJ91514.1 HxlR family transcriptional regulator [Alteromonas sp. Mac2]ALM89661.1 Transcriptional regulator, HxlR [Alteromonas stellipolaris LMG 21856]AMJ75245.1 HxlR family transcriptional regulator [Alteromonas stellipolaris]AMJ87651.1 HxlR family transcriptional regulator [Alteromonas sp. Mac1]ANB21637.1 HxlR family transcriptional regulator [Alteromonas stellipolaris]